jgi:tryptophanyl-tRNA synthetase
LRAATYEVAAAYLAAGIDPERCVIFNQSAVAAHTELAWLLGCLTPLGWLNRMTQFKEKAGRDREHAGFGLYAYPTLMAADILLYKATHVPVGEDQKQHLEFTRDLAGTFNSRYGVDYFPLPEPVIQGEGTRIMSLRDGTKKMSKSDASDLSRINLADDAQTIRRKISRAKTDPEPLPDTLEGLEGRPEAENLLTIFAALTDSERASVLARFAGRNFSEFKAALGDVIVGALAPIGEQMTRLMADRPYLDGLLCRGAERAGAMAEGHMAEIKELVGLVRPHAAEATVPRAAVRAVRSAG